MKRTLGDVESDNDEQKNGCRLITLPYDIVEVILANIPFCYLPLLTLTCHFFRKNIEECYLIRVKTDLLSIDLQKSKYIPKEKHIFPYTHSGVKICKISEKACFRNLTVHGDFRILKLLWRDRIGGHIIKNVMKYGQLELLKHMYHNLGYDFNHSHFEIAMSKGQKNVVYYMLDVMHLEIQSCSFKGCIKNGHTQFLLDLIKTGKLYKDSYDTEPIIYSLVGKGDIESIKVIQSIHKTNWFFTRGALEVINVSISNKQYLFIRQYLDFCESIGYTYQFPHGDYVGTILKLISSYLSYKNTKPSTQEICDLVTYCAQRGATFPRSIKDFGSGLMDETLLSFLITNGVEFAPEYYTVLAVHSKYDLIKSTYNKYKVPIPAKVYYEAAKDGNKEMIQWLSDIYCK